MRIPIAFKPSGIRTCPICGDYKPTKTMTLSYNGEEHSTAALCPSCILDKEFVIDVTDPVTYGKKERKRTQKIAKRSEQRTAEETGGRQTGYIPCSGDSRNSRFFFEDKTRIGDDRKSFRLTQDIITKGRTQALRSGLIPVFRIHLRDVTIGAMLWDDLVGLVQEENSGKKP